MLIFSKRNELIFVKYLGSSNETEPSSILIVFFATAAGFILVLGKQKCFLDLQYFR